MVRPRHRPAVPLEPFSFGIDRGQGQYHQLSQWTWLLAVGLSRLSLAGLGPTYMYSKLLAHHATHERRGCDARRWHREGPEQVGWRQGLRRAPVPYASHRTQTLSERGGSERSRTIAAETRPASSPVSGSRDVRPVPSRGHRSGLAAPLELRTQKGAWPPTGTATRARRAGSLLRKLVKHHVARTQNQGLGV